MIVYVVEEGAYSDRRLAAVCTDELTARRIARYNDDYADWSAWEVSAEVPPVWRTYTCRITPRGRFTRVRYHHSDPAQSYKPMAGISQGYRWPQATAHNYPTPQAAQQAAQQAWDTSLREDA